MKLSDFHNWLNNYLNFEKTQTKNIFWLDSMKFLCQKLGNPQDTIPCIHVAGSKGKGSCSMMLSSILEEAGYKCGLYTSPHITDFRERITRPHSFFEDEIYEKSADELTKLVDSIPLSELPGQRPLTWFELVTVFAFLCYKNAKCNFVIYEVGLGGRLDSTNIVTPLVSVLMPIELEHTEFLGNTIKEIANEKAGIIKNNTPTVIAPQNYQEAEEVFENKCKETKSKCIFVKNNIKKIFYEYTKNAEMNFNCDLQGNINSRIATKLKLLGKVQAFNAATAVCAIKTAIPEIKDNTIEKGLSKAFLPGRFEIVNNFVLDGAHTVKSINNTINTLKEVFPQKKYHLIFACAGDKDIKDIIPLLRNHFNTITFTQPESVRHCDADYTKRIADLNNIPSEVMKDTKEALTSVRTKADNNDIILVTGSFYLVSEIKSLLNI